MPSQNGLIEIALLSLGLLIGAKIPDIDLAPALLVLKHRSWLTHGPLWAALAWLAAARFPEALPLCVGLLAGVTLHLLEDANPRGWNGGARVNLAPLPVALHPALSFLWLVGSAAFTAWVFWGIV